MEVLSADDGGNYGDTRVSLSAGGQTKSVARARRVNDRQSVDTTRVGGDDYETAARLSELEAKHQQSKAQVDAIRKALGGTHIK